MEETTSRLDMMEIDPSKKGGGCWVPQRRKEGYCTVV